MICKSCAADDCANCEDKQRWVTHDQFINSTGRFTGQPWPSDEQIRASRPYDSCTCQHGHPIEQDPEDPDAPFYIDYLPPEDPRRIAYEQRVRRKINDGISKAPAPI